MAFDKLFFDTLTNKVSSPSIQPYLWINYLTKDETGKRTRLLKYLGKRGPEDKISGCDGRRKTDFPHFQSRYIDQPQREKDTNISANNLQQQISGIQAS